MTVHFIGAGPGAPDLITVRGRNLIANAPGCLYAGSLVPEEVLEEVPRGARILDTASMTLPLLFFTKSKTWCSLHFRPRPGVSLAFWRGECHQML